MKTNPKNGLGTGFTLMELLCLLALMFIVAALIPCSFSNGKVRAQQISCASNLRQLSLAYRIWGEDHLHQFPMSVSTNQGGTLELIGLDSVVPHLMVLSNELGSAKILSCPADERASFAGSLASLTNDNISYFLAINALPAPAAISILAGDRNLSSNGIQLPPGCLYFPTQQNLTWSKSLHRQQGNVAISDGSVQQVNNKQFNAIRIQGGIATNCFVIP